MPLLVVDNEDRAWGSSDGNTFTQSQCLVKKDHTSCLLHTKHQQHLVYPISTALPHNICWCRGNIFMHEETIPWHRTGNGICESSLRPEKSIHLIHWLRMTGKEVTFTPVSHHKFSSTHVPSLLSFCDTDIVELVSHTGLVSCIAWQLITPYMYMRQFAWDREWMCSWICYSWCFPSHHDVHVFSLFLSLFFLESQQPFILYSRWFCLPLLRLIPLKYTRYEDHKHHGNDRNHCFNDTLDLLHGFRGYFFKCSRPSSKICHRTCWQNCHRKRHNSFGL